MALQDFHRAVRPVLVALPAVGLAAGGAAYFGGAPEWASRLWAVATVPVLAALVVEIVTSLRRGELGLDLVAALSMSAALAFGEYLAAAVVALMYAGGQYLESYAERRARREMTALLSRVPRTAIRHHNGELEEVPLEKIAPGDRLLIRRGDVVAVDGAVASGVAVLDQSALTGESLPVRRLSGGAVMSGSTNIGDAFDLVAERNAAESTYAGIVRLVEEAQRSKAPMARLADRYALVFLAVTVTLALAARYFSGDPIRLVAVLVVATPCPLILAVPVALVSGLSHAARYGILIKNGKALETLARVRVLVIDKTGTLTSGEAKLVSANAAPGFDAAELLRLAASLDQASKHPLAQRLVDEARGRELVLSVPSDVSEQPGEGVTGTVDSRRVVVGGTGFVAAALGLVRDALDPGGKHPGEMSVAVAVDGKFAGELLFADTLRADTARFLEGARRAGIERIVLATGDRADVAHRVASGLPIDAIRADLTPDEKIIVVLSEHKHGPVMMIGDGVNDAPALAAADVVLLVDQLERALPGLEIARHARRVALESVIAGLGLSFAGMVAAAFGYITPVQGALLQEVIDVAVILNALRVLWFVPTTQSLRT